MKKSMMRLKESPKMRVEFTNPVETPSFLRPVFFWRRKLGWNAGTSYKFLP